MPFLVIAYWHMLVMINTYITYLNWEKILTSNTMWFTQMCRIIIQFFQSILKISGQKEFKGHKFQSSKVYLYSLSNICAEWLFSLSFNASIKAIFSTFILFWLCKRIPLLWTHVLISHFWNHIYLKKICNIKVSP